MRLLERGTRGHLEIFERLARKASALDGGFLSYVVAHEQASAEFARRELAGRSETSLFQDPDGNVFYLDQLRAE